MKKFVIVALFTSFAASLFASHNKDLVYLKDSSMVKGDVLEVLPGRTVKVQTTDGNISSIQMDNVDRIEREAAVPYLQKGYRWFLYGEHFKGDMYGGALSTVYGVQLNPYLFLGPGIGFRVGEDYNGKLYMAVPLFANFRYDILNEKSTPYLDMRCGYSEKIKGHRGFYGSASLGYRIKRFQIDLGVETAPGSEFSYKVDNWMSSSHQCVSGSLKLGFEF